MNDYFDDYFGFKVFGGVVEDKNVGALDGGGQQFGHAGHFA
jgi:hypothetical protein